MSLKCANCGIKLDNDGPTETSPHWCECDNTACCLECADIYFSYSVKHKQIYCGKGECNGNLYDSDSESESEE